MFESERYSIKINEFLTMFLAYTINFSPIMSPRSRTQPFLRPEFTSFSLLSVFSPSHFAPQSFSCADTSTQETHTHFYTVYPTPTNVLKP